MNQDVTERKRAKEALRESEERLYLALEAAEQEFWDWDLTKGKMVFGHRVFVSSGVLARRD